MLESSKAGRLPTFSDPSDPNALHLQVKPPEEKGGGVHAPNASFDDVGVAPSETRKKSLAVDVAKALSFGGINWESISFPDESTNFLTLIKGTETAHLLTKVLTICSYGSPHTHEPLEVGSILAEPRRLVRGVLESESKTKYGICHVAEQLVEDHFTDQDDKDRLHIPLRTLGACVYMIRAYIVSVEPSILLRIKVNDLNKENHAAANTFERNRIKMLAKAVEVPYLTKVLSGRADRVLSIQPSLRLPKLFLLEMEKFSHLCEGVQYKRRTVKLDSTTGKEVHFGVNVFRIEIPTSKSYSDIVTATLSSVDKRGFSVSEDHFSGPSKSEDSESFNKDTLYSPTHSGQGIAYLPREETVERPIRRYVLEPNIEAQGERYGSSLFESKRPDSGEEPYDSFEESDGIPAYYVGRARTREIDRINKTIADRGRKALRLANSQSDSSPSNAQGQREILVNHKLRDACS
jgi:hypothetical protein